MGITRAALFAKLGVIRVIEPMTLQAYEDHEREIWEKDLENSPHGEAWHTSFHASRFPGDDPMACGRAAVYGLMNIPSPTPISPYLRALGDAGKDIEKQIVTRWKRAGVLLSADADAEVQTGFVDEEVWLTGNTDAVLLLPGWRRPHVVDVKTKKDTYVDDMKIGSRDADAAHRRQILTYIGLAHERSAEMWPGFDPVQDGSLYYVSRDNPRNTFEFFYTYDKEFMTQGRHKLRAWKQAFLEGELPPRPQHWKWSESPCQWCPLKKHVCKPDFKARITRLEDSAALEFATSIRPTYSYDDTRAAVIGRWERKNRKKAA